MSRTNKQWLVAAAGLGALVGSLGCGNGNCGLVVTGSDAGFSFQNVPVGAAAESFIPINDTAGTNETIQSASLDGSDAAAFTVLSPFPLAIRGGSQGQLQVRFTPRHLGLSTSTLILNTAGMGPSPISLEGLSIADGG